jgi:uncharacterized protein (UPF0262 family)
MAKLLPEIRFERSAVMELPPVRPRLLLSVARPAVAFAYHVSGKDLACFRYIPNEQDQPFDKFWAKVLFQHSDILGINFEQVTVFLHSNHWILHPDGLPKPDIFSYLGKAYSFNQPQRAAEQRLETFQNTLLFCYDDLMYQAIHASFPQAAENHILGRLIEIHADVHLKMNQKLTACIELIDDQFAYLIFNEGKLMFANLYAMSAPEDIVYYIFRVNQTLGINPKDIHVYVSGHWLQKTQVQQLIKTYFLNCHAVTNWLPPTGHLENQSFNTEDFAYLLMN